MIFTHLGCVPTFFLRRFRISFHLVEMQSVLVQNSSFSVVNQGKSFVIFFIFFIFHFSFFIFHFSFFRVKTPTCALAHSFGLTIGSLNEIP